MKHKLRTVEVLYLSDILEHIHMGDNDIITISNYIECGYFLECFYKQDTLLKLLNNAEVSQYHLGKIKDFFNEYGTDILVEMK